MAIEICAVGGYGEVGKNMTAIRIDDEVVICDMGIHLPNWIKFTEQDEDIIKLSRKSLIVNQAIPDDNTIEDWRKHVIAIIPSHAHLDHVGAVPFLAARYDAPIYGTLFTINVLKSILHDENISLPNEIIAIPVDGRAQISKNISIEFIHMTHSTPHTAMVLINTPYGAVLYGSDFKIDDTPILDTKPNYAALTRAGSKGIVCAMIDTLYAHENGKTPSESIARELLQKTMLDQNYDGKALIVTTFSSHIARLKSICEFAQKMNRRVIFLGRSLAKYAYAAQSAGIIDFGDHVEIVKYSTHVNKRLRQIQNEKEKYVLVMTGHQGEPRSVLSRIADGKFQFGFTPGDSIIFSCKTIPAQINIDNRKKLEEKLGARSVRMFMDVHVSGHGCTEDIRILLDHVKAKILIPMHSGHTQIDAFMQFIEEFGYTRNKNAFPLLNTQRITIQ